MAAKKKTPARKTAVKTPSMAAVVQTSLVALKQARKAAPVKVLGAEERKRLVFPREGAEVHVRLMEELLADHPDVLSAAAVAAGDLTAAWSRAEALAPLYAELAAFSQAVEDTMHLNMSVAWKGALDILAAARAAGRRNADIAEAIGPTEGFLKTGPRKRTKTTG